MGHLNWGYGQLALVALAFGGLQISWIGSTLGQRNRARSLGKGEFLPSLERIWSNDQTPSG
jgi:hypothetical protein